MASLYLSCRILQKQIWTTLLTIVQIILSLIALSSLSAFIFDYQNNIRAIKELPTENVSILTVFPYYDMSFAEKEIQKTPCLDIGKISYIPNVMCNEKTCSLVAYDSIIIEHYTPSLSNGKWLTVGSSQISDKIPAIVTADMKLKVGDSINIDLSSDLCISIYVQGILKKPTQYLFPESYADPEYFEADMIISNDSAIIISSEQLARLLALSNKHTLSFRLLQAQSCLIFSKGKDFITATENNINRLGKITPADDLISLYKSNTKDLIGGQTIIFIVFLQLAIIGAFSCYVIQTHRNQKTFTIYYLLGMDWKRAITIEILRNLLVVFITMLLCFVLWKLGLFQLYWLSNSQIISFFLIVLVYVCILFAFISTIYLRKLIHEDISISLKNLQKGE